MSENIKYRQLRAFMNAATTGSFRESAARLGVSQPSFSVMIHELEKDLGVSLFERTTRKCRLTESGAEFRDRLAPILDDLEDAYRGIKEIGSGVRGRLTLASLPSLSFGIVTQTLGDYRTKFPQVQVRLHEKKNADVRQAVLQGEVELGLGIHLGDVPGLEFLALFQDRLMLVVPPGHPLEGKPATWSALRRHPLILMSTGSAEHALRKQGIEVEPAFEVEHMSTAISMVRHGLGISIVPSSVMPGLNTDGVVAKPMVGKLVRRNLGAMFRTRRQLSRAAVAFIELLKREKPIRLTGFEPLPPPRPRG
jgi:LysR family carnitine catabolism transcriptional activator